MRGLVKFKRKMKTLHPDKTYQELVWEMVSRWQAQGVELNSGTTEDELELFEKRCGLSLPLDFRCLYSVVNGMSDLDMDDYLFSLWPLQRIVAEEALHKHSFNRKVREIPFGDFLIDSHRYLLVIDESGGSTVWVQWGEKLSDSFSDFINSYLKDPNTLHLMKV
jgi:hypothetical protein